jgi:hypothetical protein
MELTEAQELAKLCRCADIHRCPALYGTPNLEMDFGPVSDPYDD